MLTVDVFELVVDAVWVCETVDVFDWLLELVALPDSDGGSDGPVVFVVVMVNVGVCELL